MVLRMNWLCNIWSWKAREEVVRLECKTLNVRGRGRGRGCKYVNVKSSIGHDAPVQANCSLTMLSFVKRMRCDPFSIVSRSVCIENVY